MLNDKMIERPARDDWPILHRESQMEIINGLIIENQSIAIDDKHFIDCTLVNCILEYSGTNVAFESTQLRGCRYVFHGRARQTLQFLQGVGLMAFNPQEWGEFAETVN